MLRQLNCLYLFGFMVVASLLAQARIQRPVRALILRANFDEVSANLKFVSRSFPACSPVPLQQSPSYCRNYKLPPGYFWLRRFI